MSAHWDGSVYSPNDGVISILSYDNPCRTYKGSYCNRVPQYGHNGDTVDIVISGHSHVRQFGNAANDLGRVFRERKWNTVNFGVRKSTPCPRSTATWVFRFIPDVPFHSHNN